MYKYLTELEWNYQEGDIMHSKVERHFQVILLQLKWKVAHDSKDV